MPDIKIFILLGLVAFASYLKDKVGKSPELHLTAKAGYHTKDDAKFMELAIHADGSDSHEVVHGAVIVRNGDVIGKGWSDSLGTGDLQNTHAEFSAIHDALKDNGNSLHGCSLFTTSYPCNECLRLIQRSGITRIYYGIDTRNRAAASENHAGGHSQSVGAIAIPLPSDKAWNSTNASHSY